MVPRGLPPVTSIRISVLLKGTDVFRLLTGSCHAVDIRVVRLLHRWSIGLATTRPEGALDGFNFVTRHCTSPPSRHSWDETKKGSAGVLMYGGEHVPPAEFPKGGGRMFPWEWTEHALV